MVILYRRRDSLAVLSILHFQCPAFQSEHDPVYQSTLVNPNVLAYLLDLQQQQVSLKSVANILLESKLDLGQHVMENMGKYLYSIIRAYSVIVNRRIISKLLLGFETDSR